jgi:hypothetical protein
MKLFSDSLIRRYTPPTCTLEIWAKPSPLSFWSDRQLVKDLRFELCFDDPRRLDDDKLAIRGDRSQLEALSQVVGDYVQCFLQPSSFRIPVAAETLALPHPLEISKECPSRLENLRSRSLTSPAPPVLRPKGLVFHELCLGSLTADTSNPSIRLSVSQLFDLAEVLEQSSLEIAALPALTREKKRRNTLIWASAAAATVLAVGLATVGTRVYQASQKSADILASEQETNSAPAPQSDSPTVIPPAPVAPSEPVPTPTLPPALANRDRLPPPPAVGTNQTSSKVSVPPVLPPPPSSPTKASTPPVASSNSPKTSSSEQTTIAVVPNETAKQPKTPANNTSNNTSKRPTAQTTPNDSVSRLPTLTPLQPGAERETEAPIDAAAANSSKPDEKTAPVDGSNSTTTAYNPSARERDNLLDTIPQVAEARQYFQSRWQVPQGLKQRLEYRLTVNQAGEVARIVPLGRAANIYLDRTEMPLLGTQFVSPLAAKNQQATFRLVLSPDGSVKTFLEE